MNCKWNELLAILPAALRQETDRLGRNNALELRLRLGSMPAMRLPQNMISFGRIITADDLHFVVNSACRYSPWTAESASAGYITAPGGHRIGICGEVVEKAGRMCGFRAVRSLNVRIARDFTGIAEPLRSRSGSILIIGPPGCGKTTLMRDLIRLRSEGETVCVVDERGELFPQGYPVGQRTDILTGCNKVEGIDTLLRTMGPEVIAVDEITSQEDCRALLSASWCGVQLLATAHAASYRDLRTRAVYRPLVETAVFDYLVTLQRDKSFTVERMSI